MNFFEVKSGYGNIRLFFQKYIGNALAYPRLAPEIMNTLSLSSKSI